MPSLNFPETTKWVVAHNNNNTFIPGKIEPQNNFATGQPFLDVFDTREAAISAYPSLSAYFIE